MSTGAVVWLMLAIAALVANPRLARQRLALVEPKRLQHLRRVA